MRRAFVIFIGCAVASIGLSFAQVLETDASNALGTEWQDTTNAIHCLNALGLYTTYTGDPDGAIKAALQELVAGDSVHAELYKAAQGQPGFLNLLATAQPKDYKPGDDQTLFQGAKDVVKKIYGCGELEALSAVHKSSQSQHYTLALFQLLSTYRKKSIDVGDMQTLRVCYKNNPKRLFKIVDDVFAPASDKPE
jgi:hypothetical protein